MENLFIGLIRFITIIFKSKIELAGEVLVLRQQLAIINRNKPDVRYKMRVLDRIIIIIGKSLIKKWRKMCFIIKPETVIKWHRNLIKNHWKWITYKRAKVHTKLKKEIKQLIIKIKQENIYWGAERIRGELLKLDIKVSKRTIQKIIRTVECTHKFNGGNWKTFLKNHINDIFCCDFFTVDTVLFKRYYVFFIISHLTREIFHINFTEHPTAEWVKQQIKQALRHINKNIYLIHDRDSKISYVNFNGLNITPMRISYSAPDMNAYAERFVSSVRHECLDHYIILSEKHLKRVLFEYKEYYNSYRPHQGIMQKIPAGCIDIDNGSGNIREVPILDGLHHHYFRSEIEKNKILHISS